MEELSEALGMNKKTLWKLLSEMIDKGILKKVKRGVYTVVKTQA